MKEEKIQEALIEETEERESDFNEGRKSESHDQQRIKNLISLCILLGGLFLGSLFVDLSQLISGGGFSKRVVKDMDIVSLDGKTWVAYSDPIVNLEVITDDSCENCDADQIVMQLRQMIPTMLASDVDTKTQEGEDAIEKYGVNTLPAFVFSKEIEETDFFLQASSVLNEVDGKYVLNSTAAGIPVGKYIELPSIDDEDIQIGSEDAKVTLIEFSDFQCPYCKAFNETIGRIIDEYGDDVRFVFKQLPLEAIHPNARTAALASECANEQGKFLDYADKLFENQKDWGSAEGNQKFKTYALQIGLNSSQFNVCLDEEKYSDKIDADMSEADQFGINATPSLFVNDQFGVASFESLKQTIDEYLGKEEVEQNGEESSEEEIDEMIGEMNEEE